jgi:hypothetical protein
MQRYNGTIFVRVHTKDGYNKEEKEITTPCYHSEFHGSLAIIHRDHLLGAWVATDYVTGSALTRSFESGKTKAAALAALRELETKVTKEKALQYRKDFIDRYGYSRQFIEDLPF